MTGTWSIVALVEVVALGVVVEAVISGSNKAG